MYFINKTFYTIEQLIQIINKNKCKQTQLQIEFSQLH